MLRKNFKPPNLTDKFEHLSSKIAMAELTLVYTR